MGVLGKYMFKLKRGVGSISPEKRFLWPFTLKLSYSIMSKRNYAIFTGMSMKQILSSALLLACISTAHAAAPPIVAGKTYDAARQALAGAGITPLTQAEVAKVSNEPADDLVAEQRQKGRPEVESCSSGGMPYCYYLLRNKAGDVFGASVYIPEDGSADRVEMFEKTDRRLPAGGVAYQADDATIALNDLQKRVGTDKCDEACVQEEIERLAPKKLAKIGKTTDPLTRQDLPDFRRLNIAELMEATQVNGLPAVVLGSAQFDFDSSPLTKSLYLASKKSARSCAASNGKQVCTLIFMNEAGYMMKVDMAGTELGNMRAVSLSLANADDDMEGISDEPQRFNVQMMKDKVLADIDPAAFRALAKKRYQTNASSQMMTVLGLDTNVRDDGTCNRLLNRAYLFVGSNSEVYQKDQAINETITVLNKSGCLITPM